MQMREEAFTLRTPWTGRHAKYMIKGMVDCLVCFGMHVDMVCFIQDQQCSITDMFIKSIPCRLIGSDYKLVITPRAMDIPINGNLHAQRPRVGVQLAERQI